MNKEDLRKELKTIKRELNDLRLLPGNHVGTALFAYVLTAFNAVDLALNCFDQYEEVFHE